MTAHRLDNAGALIDVAEPVHSGRVVAKFEYEGSMTAGAGGGQASLWKPTFPVKKNHLYWVVGSVTLRWAENGEIELVVWRSKANVEILKVRAGGGRDSTSGALTAFSTYISTMFVAEADGDEPLWIVANVPAAGMWLYSYAESTAGNDAELRHNIYVIDMGPADALVPDNLAGHRLDNAGAITDVPGVTPVVANVHTTDHVAGAAGGQANIMTANWTAKPGHQYLVIASFTAIHPNSLLRDYWMFDEHHNVNPARTRLGTFAGPSHNQAQQRPVALVAVLDGSNSAAIYGNRAAGDSDWLTMNADHRLLVFDLGPK